MATEPPEPSSLRRALSVVTGGLIPSASPTPALPASFSAFDHLATMVAVVDVEGQCLLANARFEAVLGLSRRAMVGQAVGDWFADPVLLTETIGAVARNEFETSRLQARLKRSAPTGEPLPVHVIVTQLETGRPGEAIVELVELEQQARQDREERALEQAPPSCCRWRSRARRSPSTRR
jgi:two-component system nitrogen regulation sensor histidine kinase GlnL